MATKSSKSDGFANPLYDKLLQYCDRNATRIFGERWWYEWTEEELRKARGGWGSDEPTPTLPPKPNPLVDGVEWQRTLRSKVTARNEPHGFKLVDAGVVDLAVKMRFPTLDYDDETKKYTLSKVWESVHVLYLCRPALTSVAKTLRELNAMRDRDRQYGVEEELFGIITANLDPVVADVIGDQNYDLVQIGPDELQ